MTRNLSIATAMVLMLAFGPAQAVPCGPWSTTGGIYQATACQDGGLGDANDSLADLNGGNYFGHNDWLLLTRTSDENDNGNFFWEVSYHVANDGVAGRTGAFILGAEIWRYFQDLAVVLKDGGSFTNNRIKWSAYLLPQDQYGPYNWSYDGDHKQIGHMSLYARLRPVSEPGSLALVASGLVAMGLVLRRRERVRPQA